MCLCLVLLQTCQSQGRDEAEARAPGAHGGSPEPGEEQEIGSDPQALQGLAPGDGWAGGAARHPELTHIIQRCPGEPPRRIQKR